MLMGDWALGHGRTFLLCLNQGVHGSRQEPRPETISGLLDRFLVALTSGCSSRGCSSEQFWHGGLIRLGFSGFALSREVKATVDGMRRWEG